MVESGAAYVVMGKKNIVKANLIDDHFQLRGEGQLRNISQVIVDPDFDEEDFKHDIALAQLTKDVEFSGSDL